MQLLYSCYHTRNREGEQFVADHVLACQVSGTLLVDDGRRVQTFEPGDLRLSRRNHLLKFTKLPPPGGDYLSMSLRFDQETLRRFAMAYGYEVQRHEPGEAIVVLPPSARLRSFMDSLSPYRDTPAAGDEALLALKAQEAILLLLQTMPSLKTILFDFSEPGKIDLEGFMNTNYHFNVELKRFAYLTGRSLATFKRDFEKVFHLSPSRWLLQRRLQEAYRLITEKGKAPSDVYLDVGFEDLSHFSFAFKKHYGVAPSKVLGG
ncbi:helix-turn-helix domain-containing protein [Chitinophaga vietnamensis]|uniref:helix-turn-helix domain-containing protein n=1 Tax=Chitinophaga vietnamensis TaxID=2593957 RepID=UPI0011787C55|nr:AraC family transcriptional regulator [Chitinophaga vietnamensis]